MFNFWCEKWGISKDALEELKDILGVVSYPDSFDTCSLSETAIQNKVRLDALKNNMILWRNNTGVAYDARGVPVRFGLCNDTPKVNSAVKSSDLIGIKRIKITKDLIGQTLGQFVAREVKKSTWKFKGTKEEHAQLKFLEIVSAWGGDAKFINKI